MICGRGVVRPLISGVPKPRLSVRLSVARLLSHIGRTSYSRGLAVARTSSTIIYGCHVVSAGGRSYATPRQSQAQMECERWIEALRRGFGGAALISGIAAHLWGRGCSLRDFICDDRPVTRHGERPWGALRPRGLACRGGVSGRSRAPLDAEIPASCRARPGRDAIYATDASRCGVFSLVIAGRHGGASLASAPLVPPARLYYHLPHESAPSGRSQRASARAARKAISYQLMLRRFPVLRKTIYVPVSA
jgi:hypothetical protein